MESDKEKSINSADSKLEGKVEFKGEVKPEEATEPKVTEHMDTKTPINDIETPEKKFLKDFEKNSSEVKRKKVIKLAIAFGGIVLGILFLGILGVIFKLDSFIFPSTVFGKFMDFSSRPLESVQICIQTKCVFTDNQGLYSIEGLKYGKYDITATKDRYYKFIETIDIQRGKNEVNREMQPFGFGEIRGFLKTETELNPTDLKLFLDDAEVALDSENAFVIKDKMIGTYRLKLVSPFYQDFDLAFELKEGLRDFGEIVLVESRDVSFNVKDWISNQPINTVAILIGEKTVNTDPEGNAIFADLPIASKYDYKITKDGYKTIEESITLSDNTKLIDLNSIRMVRMGKTFYTSNRSGNYNIYTSDYDGSNEKMVSDNKGSNFAPKLSTDGKSIFFLSTRDGFHGAYNELIPVVYKVNLDGSGLSKITQTKYEDNGSIGYYDYNGGKRAYTRYSNDGSGSVQDLYFGNINGTEMSKVFTLPDNDGYFASIVISPNGKSIVAIYNDYTLGSPVSRIIHINPTNGEKRNLYEAPPYYYPTLLEFSSDSNSILALTSSHEDVNVNLYRIFINENKVLKITNNSNIERDAFFTPDSKKVIFFDVRDSKMNIYVKDSTGANELQLTESGKIEGIMQVTNNLVTYIEDNQLMIVDINYPKVIQKVSSNVSFYQGSGWVD